MKSEWMKSEIILTIYAAVISTISLVWNIILAVLEKRSHLKVIAEFRDTFTGNDREQLVAGPKVLYIRIINESKYTKHHFTTFS